MPNKKWQVQNHYMVIQEILFLSIISNTTQDIAHAFGTHMNDFIYNHLGHQ